ncbi:MAG: helix-turn-helix transcriptional regulator [Patescibacteria group bacterium]
MPSPNTIEKNEFTLKVALEIQKLRKSKKISQEELAEKANLNTSYIGHLERGLYSPTLYVMWKIAKALKVTLSDLTKGI